MIIYFSATGNCAFIAKKIAQATLDRAVSMTAIKEEIRLNAGENLGIVIPTYFWGLPSYVDEFLKGITIKNAENAYIFCVATYGTTTGQIDYFVNKRLKQKGLRLLASYSIKTVDNWTVFFDVNDKQEISKTLERERAQTQAVIKDIKARREVFISKDKKSLFLSKGARRFYEKARKTSHLHVNEACISCGLCGNICPVQAIKITGGKPTWVKDKCVMCLKCLHHCPKFAIQYDDKTQKNGQYLHPNE